MSNTQVKVNLAQVTRLGKDFEEAAEVGLRRVVLRGEDIMREEVPQVTGNLRQGVSSFVSKTRKNGVMFGQIIVSARSGRVAARQATLHLSSGATKQVNLRPVARRDYARDVAEGTGIYGANGAPVTPNKAKAMLIPVSTVPSGKDGKPESYIESGGQKFILRRAQKGRKANNYHIRTANRLLNESGAIVERAFADVEASRKT